MANSFFLPYLYLIWKTISNQDFDGLILWLVAAAKLGITSPPAYLSVSQNVDTLLKAVNYAFGGVGIVNDTGLYFVSRTSSNPPDSLFTS